MIKKSKYNLERDAVFVRDLDIAIDALQSIKSVHDFFGHIHDDYVLEKLKVAKDVIENSIGYWSLDKTEKADIE